MTDEDYNADLTWEERPLHSRTGGTIDGTLATDEGGFKRFINPVTGGGLWNTNSDPNVVGIDPLTGAASLVGSDVGFGAPMRRYFATQVYNGAFEEPPPDTASPIGDDNPLPYWRWVEESGTALTPYWVSVGGGAGNGQVNVSMAAGAAGDRAYFEQLVPVNPSQGNFWTYQAMPYLGGFFGTLDAYVHVQFLDATGATVGSAGTASGSSSVSEPVWPDTDGSSPGTAAYLRLRVGWQRNAGAATTDTGTGILGEAAVAGSHTYGTLPSVNALRDYGFTPATPPAGVGKLYHNADELYWLNDSGTVDQLSHTQESGTWTPVLTAATPGDLPTPVTYSIQVGRYLKVGTWVNVNFKLTTTNWTWTTASGLLKVGGLPYTVATVTNNHWTGSIVFRYTRAGYTSAVSLVSSGDATVYFMLTGTGVAPVLTSVADTPSATQVTMQGSVWYEATS